MSCGCGQHRTGRGPIDRPMRTLPETECVLCGEKHLDTARAWWIEGQVSGYTVENRPSMVGELCAAAFHVWPKDRRLAEILRDIRHLIQNRKEFEVDWLPALEAMDRLVQSELRDPTAEHPPIPRDPTA